MCKKTFLSLFLLLSIFAINAGNINIGDTTIKMIEDENVFVIQVNDAIDTKDFQITEDSIYGAIETSKTIFCIYMEKNLLEFYDYNSNGKMRIQAPFKDLNFSLVQAWFDEENNLWTLEIPKFKQEEEPQAEENNLIEEIPFEKIENISAE